MAQAEGPAQQAPAADPGQGATPPAGLREPVYHTWQKNGRTVAIMPSTTLQGGRSGGFRVYSWKADLGADPTGVWQVEVRAAGGQLIGRAQLLVIDP